MQTTRPQKSHCPNSPRPPIPRLGDPGVPEPSPVRVFCPMLTSVDRAIGRRVVEKEIARKGSRPKVHHSWPAVQLKYLISMYILLSGLYSPEAPSSRTSPSILRVGTGSTWPGGLALPEVVHSMFPRMYVARKRHLRVTEAPRWLFPCDFRGSSLRHGAAPRDLWGKHTGKPGSKANARYAAPVVDASPGGCGRSVRVAPLSNLARSRPSRFVSVRRSAAAVAPADVSAGACPRLGGVRSATARP